MKDVVVYSPIQSPTRPFYYYWAWRTRDEMRRMGLDDLCHKAIIEYSTSRKEGKREVS